VEIRVPFVDARLLRGAERDGFEPMRRGGKRAVARSLAPELPAELFDRPKSGFQLPIAEWLDDRPRGVPVGGQSRRLAMRVLESFGVPGDEISGALRAAAA
jgi:hypothetical protein